MTAITPGGHTLIEQRHSDRRVSPAVGEHAMVLLAQAQARIAELKAALRIIAGEEQCADNLISNPDVARAALGPPVALPKQARAQRSVVQAGMGGSLPDGDFGLTDEVIQDILIASSEAYNESALKKDKYAALRTGIVRVVRDYLNAADRGIANTQPSAEVQAQASLPVSAAPPDGWTSDPPEAGSLPPATPGEAMTLIERLRTTLSYSHVGLALLREAADALEAQALDAARYQWIKEFFFFERPGMVEREKLDEAIDAAMLGLPKP